MIWTTKIINAQFKTFDIKLKFEIFWTIIKWDLWKGMSFDCSWWEIDSTDNNLDSRRRWLVLQPWLSLDYKWITCFEFNRIEWRRSWLVKMMTVCFYLQSTFLNFNVYLHLSFATEWQWILLKEISFGIMKSKAFNEQRIKDQWLDVVFL